MSITTPVSSPAALDAGHPPVASRRSLWSLATLPIFGSLWWLRWLWLAVTVLAAGILVALTVSGAGDLENSLWQQIAAGWQRFPLAAVGFTMATSFTTMFVTNGLTRRRLAEAAIVTTVVIAALSALWLTAGYLLERPVFAANGWTHAFGNGRTIGGVGAATIALTLAVLHAAYIAGGWLLGLGYRTGSWIGLVLVLPAALVPAVAAEALIAAPINGGSIEALDEFFARVTRGGLPVAVPVVVAITAATCLVAARWNRTVAVE